MSIVPNKQVFHMETFQNPENPPSPNPVKCSKLTLEITKTLCLIFVFVDSNMIFVPSSGTF